MQVAEDVAKLAVRDPERVAYVTQTTLSMDDTAHIIEALRRRFPEIQGPRQDDICYATQNRQDAAKKLARQCEVLLVVGSRNSSNSNRLREIAEAEGAVAHLVDGPDDIHREWLIAAQRVGVTAGASAGSHCAASRGAAQGVGWQERYRIAGDSGKYYIRSAEGITQGRTASLNRPNFGFCRRSRVSKP